MILFLLQLYQIQKDDPPLARNMPPVAGKILWVRQLFRRINEPIDYFYVSWCEEKLSVVCNHDVTSVEWPYCFGYDVVTSHMLYLYVNCYLKHTCSIITTIVHQRCSVSLTYFWTSAPSWKYALTWSVFTSPEEMSHHSSQLWISASVYNGAD